MPAEIALPTALTLASDTHHVGRDTSHVGLLALVFTERRNVARRAAVRQTWLSHAWSLPSNFTWRYAFVEARAPRTGASKQSALRGDTLVLASVEESYLNLVHKTVAALRWSLAHVPFDTLLKTDDDSIVHVGRVWSWLAAQPTRRALYAGRLVRDSQVVRAHFSRADLREPQWYPADFLAWAVPRRAYAAASYPPYASGGGYVLGAEAAAALLAQHDARLRAGRGAIPVEDAYVGVLASEAGVAPAEMPGVIDLLPHLGGDGGAQKWDEATGRRYLADKLVAHRVVKPRRALRWLLLSANSPAEWRTKEAFWRADCPHCEDVIFNENIRKKSL